MMEEGVLSAREKILEAADTLFGELGFDAATTREIAERSGVNKALIHYHFKSKEELLYSVLDRYYENLAQSLKAPILAKGDIRDRVMRLIDVYVDFLSSNLNFSRIIQREATGEKNATQIVERTVPLFQLGMKFMKEAFPETRAGDLAAEHLLVSFYGMIVTYFTYSGVLEHLVDANPLSKRNLESRKRHLRRMAELILDEIQSAT